MKPNLQTKSFGVYRTTAVHAMKPTGHLLPFEIGQQNHSSTSPSDAQSLLGEAERKSETKERPGGKSVKSQRVHKAA